ncbi:nucleotide-binding protein [Agrobacterium tumefaciens]|uniref:hypothetical protein n=1 Tax=Agrobacterium tumefaciens TaxID=358 RepID=UPI001574897C|nr:hypothetical protein [Agrobacterium tumefaciens]NTA84129.1 nucleotide-binding protein [Agrobacterium tumefaciens]
MIKAFFSWQSDTDQSVTTDAIRDAIANGAANAAIKTGQEIVPDEATRDVPGAPHIPGKLIDKIRGGDIFIADITSIASTGTGKSLPNPNVVFELGLAVAHLGWDRVVLLFNSAIAEPRGLPFDFEKHRYFTFEIAPGGAGKKDKAALTNIVEDAFVTIIDQNPPRPKEIEGKSEDDIKRAHDVANLKWFFRHMSLDWIGRHISEMPDMLYFAAPSMHDQLTEVLTNPSFFLYDNKLEKQLRSFVRTLDKTLRYDEFYRELNSPGVQAFGIGGPWVDRNAEAAAVQDILKHVSALERVLDRILKVIRSRYLEVDLNELGSRFNEEYRRSFDRTQIPALEVPLNI